MDILKKSRILFEKYHVVKNIRSVKSRQFSIIASNCTGTLPYRFLNLQYKTPTVSLFFYAPDYIKFVKHLDYYLDQPLRFESESYYKKAQMLQEQRGYYPIGKLDDIEIHFLHYDNEMEAHEKWTRRKRRINKDHLVLVFTDKDLCTPELLAEFDALPYPRKIAFTAKNYPKLRSCLALSEFASQQEIGDTYTNYHTISNLDFSALIDGTDIDETNIDEKRRSNDHKWTPKHAA